MRRRLFIHPIWKDLWEFSFLFTSRETEGKTGVEIMDEIKLISMLHFSGHGDLFSDDPTILHKPI